MISLPLTFGPLRGGDFSIRRSGVTWLCEDGHSCRPDEVIAHCNIGLEPAPGRMAADPFAGERELQVAFAPRIGGVLRRAEGTSPGGHLAVLGVQPWKDDAVLGFIEAEEDEAMDADAGRLRLLLLAGRRVSAMANVETGLLPGWHQRSRGWWLDAAAETLSTNFSNLPAGPEQRLPTLLSMGICDATGPMRGERGAFTELFEAAPYPAQIVFVSDHPVTPCAPVLTEQLLRTPAQLQAIARDIRQALSEGRVAPSADDWFFAATLLAALERSPLRETYPTLSPQGATLAGPADAVLLSLNAEFPTLLRHRELGYTLHIMRHHQLAAGPAMQAWLASAFQPFTRTIADIKRDYAKLLDLADKETGARFLVINRMSTSGQEDITSYAAFDAPMAGTLETIAAKELNLMLHELATDRNIAIIDIDNIAAALGAAAHLPDGMHQSGLMQGWVRAEIFRQLRA